MALNPSLKELKLALGDRYRILSIDWRNACTVTSGTASTSKSADAAEPTAKVRLRSISGSANTPTTGSS